MYTIPWTTDARPIVRPGDRYKVVAAKIICRSGYTHLHGEILDVVQQTVETPYDEVGPYGYNWRVHTKHDYSVWSTLESCIERGLLQKV